MNAFLVFEKVDHHEKKIGTILNCSQGILVMQRNHTQKIITHQAGSLRLHSPDIVINLHRLFKILKMV